VVEHDLAKVGVEGSNPFARSILLRAKALRRILIFPKMADRQFRPQGRRQAALLYGAGAAIIIGCFPMEQSWHRR
jgi:hypothetical protein